jgi:hypothetical protein
MGGEIFIYLIMWIIAAFLIAEIGKKRTIGYWGAVAVSILLSPLLGLLITGFSDRVKEEVHRYKEPYEQAKKEEFKGNIATAIDKYQDALYYLLNDYPNLKPKWQKAHQSIVNSIKVKIEELKKRDPHLDKTN